MPSPSPVSAAKLKALRLLQAKKHRLETGTCLIEGRRFVQEALERPDLVETLLVTKSAADTAEVAGLLSGAARNGVVAFTLTEPQLGALSDTVASQGVLAVIRMPSADPGAVIAAAGASGTVVALDGVSDPGNVGTIIRTCAWFGASGLLLSEGSVELSNPKVLRSTMGAVFAIPVATGADLAASLARMKRDGFRILAAEAGASPARKALSGKRKRVLVFGSEAHGISAPVRKLADSFFGIPGSGKIESLNVSVAVGVSLEIALSENG